MSMGFAAWSLADRGEGAAAPSRSPASISAKKKAGDVIDLWVQFERYRAVAPQAPRALSPTGGKGREALNLAGASRFIISRMSFAQKEDLL